MAGLAGEVADLVHTCGGLRSIDVMSMNGSVVGLLEKLVGGSTASARVRVIRGITQVGALFTSQKLYCVRRRVKLCVIEVHYG